VGTTSNSEPRPQYAHPKPNIGKTRDSHIVVERWHRTQIISSHYRLNHRLFAVPQLQNVTTKDMGECKDLKANPFCDSIPSFVLGMMILHQVKEKED
jgi:hypothetical protein